MRADIRSRGLAVRVPRLEPLVVSIPHHLGKEEALRRLKTGLAEVGTSFGHLFSVREQIWTGDHLRFQVSAIGQSASGSMMCRRPRAVGSASAVVFGKARRDNSAADTKGRNVAA